MINDFLLSERNGIYKSDETHISLVIKLPEIYKTWNENYKIIRKIYVFLIALV
jgi:hypothetical protein